MKVEKLRQIAEAKLAQEVTEEYKDLLDILHEEAQMGCFTHSIQIDFDPDVVGTYYPQRYTRLEILGYRVNIENQRLCYRLRPNVVRCEITISW